MSSQVKPFAETVSAEEMSKAITVLQHYLPASVDTVELILHVALELVHLNFLAELAAGPAPAKHLLDALNGWTGKANTRIPADPAARVGRDLIRPFVALGLQALRFIQPQGRDADTKRSQLLNAVSQMHSHLSAQDQEDIRQGRVIVQTPQGPV